MAPFLACSVAIVTTFLVVFVWLRKVRQKSAFGRAIPPRVPGSLPWLGNVLRIDKQRPHVTLTEWYEKFGHVYRFHMFGEDVVVLNSVTAVHDALVSKDPLVAGRPDIFRIHYGFHFVDDIIFATDSPKWRLLKRTAGALLHTTSNFDLDHVSSQMAIEMRHLAELFEEQPGVSFDPSLILQTTVINAISVLLHGRRYHHNDSQMYDYKRATRLFSEACSPVSGAEIDLFPWLRFLPHKPLRKLTEARSLLDSIVDIELARAKAEFDPDRDEVTCFLHGLLKMRHEPATFSDGSITDDDVRAVFIDILVSGTLTTWIALKAFVLLMVYHPEIQTKLASHVDAAIGPDRLPTTHDRNHLELMDATILEVLRYLSHVPLSLPHFTTDNTSICEYSIPKHTKVLINLWSIHHDPSIWTDPWSFRPERFIDSEGKLLPPDHRLRQSLMPFGLGRRMCLGQSFALQRLFLLATFIIQRFKLCPPGDEPLPSCDPRNFELGLILEPLPFKIQAVPRH